MAGFWKRALDKLIFSPQAADSDFSRLERPQPAQQTGTRSAPSQPIVHDETIHPENYPHTYPLGLSDSDRPKLFDPALKQFTAAFRRGDPVFKDRLLGYQWCLARRHVFDHMLRLIAGSRWRQHLVLRGSVLQRAWLGDAAREPGDIDWVFQPENVSKDSATARDLLDDLKQMLAEQPRRGAAEVLIDRITADDIWTYERASGRRIVIPWQAPDMPPLEVQMDIVFREPLLIPPVEMTIPSPDGGSVSLLAATRELALAWKLLWLETDMYAQGKDLYDAVLLAEQCRLPLGLLQAVFEQSGARFVELTADFPAQLVVDWESFQLEYPDVGGTQEEWNARLVRALAESTFCRPASP